MKLQKVVGIWLICLAVFQFVLALTELNTIFYGFMSAINLIFGILLIQGAKEVQDGK